MKESEIRQQVRDYLRWRGWFVYYNLQGLGSYPGLSDLVAIKKGRILHIELKTKRGRQSERQKQFQEKLEASGGEYVLCRGVDDLESMGI